MNNIVIGCVAENTPKYLSQALRLLQSIRWFGGSIADADFIVCIVDAVNEDCRKKFEKWGATVKIVSRFSPVHPQSNKLRFLELADILYYELIILMDCDTIILQDPSRYLNQTSMKARMAGYPTVSTKIFRKLFSHFGIMMPVLQYQCAVSGDPTIWYCNAGVLIFPNAILKTLFPIWKELTIELCKKISLLGDSYNFCEQASLTLAFVKNPVPFDELPIEMNCPIPSNITRTGITLKSCDPIVIHYHNQIDEYGLVISNSNSFAKKRIDDFNKRLLSELNRTV